MKIFSVSNIQYNKSTQTIIDESKSENQSIIRFLNPMFYINKLFLLLLQDSI